MTDVEMTGSGVEDSVEDSVEDTHTVMEVSTAAVNDPDLSKAALQLQKKMQQLKTQLVKSEALLRVSQRGGEEEVVDEQAEQLSGLTKKGTDTLLTFHGLQMAVQAAEANQVLTKALNLDTEGNIELEAEEEQYVRELLEEQKELAASLCAANTAEVEAELKLIERHAELAQLYCTNRSLMAKTLGAAKHSQEAMDGETKRMQKALKESDSKLNQLRFIIQKFMLSHDKFGLQFDEDTNKEFEALLLRCGVSPEEQRQQMMAEAVTPAATGDFIK